MINVRFEGKNIGTLGGKFFNTGDVREVDGHCAGLCDGKVWVNLDAKPETAKKDSAPAKDKEPAKKVPTPDVDKESPSPVEGLSEEQVNECLAVLPDILGNAELCLKDGRPTVDALEEAADFKISAQQRDEIYGLHLELSGGSEE